MFDPYPIQFPPQWRFPSKVDPMEQEKRRNSALRDYAEKWQIKNWINLNTHLHMPIEKWVGKDWFQERFGLDQVVADVISFTLEQVQAESKHQANAQGQTNHTQQMESPELRFPQKL